MLDTHCHLTHERYQADLDDVLSRAASSGIDGVIAIASDLRDADAVRALIDRDEPPELWGTAGIHPHESREAGRGFRADLIDALRSHERVVAVGECGLDYHYDISPRETQLRVFETQVEVAAELELPLVVHCRNAESDMMARVREAGAAGVRGVLHCFPGDLELLDVAVANGWFVSFTGLVTFRSFEGTEAVRRVPGERYMIETDGPYMAPVPHRGKRNEPAFVAGVRDRVAELRGVDPAVVEVESTVNARTFFAL